MFRCQLYWYNFETKEGSSVQGGGYRPSIILSNNLACKHSPVIFISPITSKFSKPKLATHVVVGAESGLNKDSIILLEQIITIDKTDLGDYIGEVPRNKVYEIDRALIISGGINVEQPKINIIDKERINNLIDSINYAIEMLEMVDNNHFRKMHSTLVTELENYCRQCGANFDIIARNRIKNYECKVQGDVVSVR